MIRIDKILTEQEPLLQNYMPENDAEFGAWQKWETAQLLDRLDNDRAAICRTVTRLTNDELLRVGIHDSWGRLALVDWLESMLLHEGHHIWTIFRLVHNVGVK